MSNVTTFFLLAENLVWKMSKNIIKNIIYDKKEMASRGEL